jgi:hypothetical protein
MPRAQNHAFEAMKKPVSLFLEKLYRDSRYIPTGKLERMGTKRITFMEICPVISPTGEERGRLLLEREFFLDGRPDAERPYGEESLLAYHLRRSKEEEGYQIGEQDVASLTEEAWQYYVRRNFHFLFGDFVRARNDAEHNLGIASMMSRCAEDKDNAWSFVRWWPWIERDRAIAQALSDVENGHLEEAATELYRANKAIGRSAREHATEYAREGEVGASMPGQMEQHIETLVQLLQRLYLVPIPLEQQLDEATARGDAEQADKIRRRMMGEVAGRD